MYNRFARQIRVLTAEMDNFGAEFLNIAERHFLKRVSHGLRRAQRQHDSISDINVTPLVDVMLVLLIIFMVTAPILQQGVADRPAEGDGRAARRAQEEQLVVNIAKTGQVYLNDTPYTPARAHREAARDRGQRVATSRCTCAPIRPCRTVRSCA